MRKCNSINEIVVNFKIKTIKNIQKSIQIFNNKFIM